MKRGAKSVMRTRPPCLSSNSVSTIAVFWAYAELTRARSAKTTSEKPFSSSPLTSRLKTGLESKRGKHHQTNRALESTSAATRQLPMSARSSGCLRGSNAPDGLDAFIEPTSRAKPTPPLDVRTRRKRPIIQCRQSRRHPRVRLLCRRPADPPHHLRQRSAFALRKAGES